MEVELKLAVDAADVDRLAASTLVRSAAIGRPRRCLLASAYFDTPDLHLLRAGLGLRVRRTGSGWTQTLKDAGRVVAGLHERHEWETPVDAAYPDLDALRAQLIGTPWQGRLDEPSLDRELSARFSTRFRRTVVPLRLPDGAEVELAFDEGELRCADATRPIGELELELRSGEPVALLAFARKLMDEVPLRLGNASKAERGYALLAPQAPHAVEASEVSLDRSTTLEQAIERVLDGALSQVQANASAVADPASAESTECLHQMRVGVRRLRCAVRLFAATAPMPDALRSELRWLGSVLGTARDADVLAQRTLGDAIAAHPEETGLAALQAAAVEAAHASRCAAAAAVDSPRYACLMLDLLLWLRARRWRDAIDASARRRLDTPARDRADVLLARADASLRARWRAPDGSTAAQRHRLRIAAKRLRYACEFFATLYKPSRIARFVAALADLQAALGTINDAAVARGLLQRIGESRPELAGAAAFVAGWAAGRADAEAARLRKRWRRATRTRPPWTR